MQSKTLKIFSVFHKAYPVPPSRFIEPIQVGKKGADDDLGFLSDDSGDNIAHKNSSYCELTALYWIWKNLDNIESHYVGLSHYRRYFVIPPYRVKRKWFLKRSEVDPAPVFSVPLNDKKLKKIGSSKVRDHLIQALEHADIVLPRAIPLELRPCVLMSIKEHYRYCHIPEDWKLMRDTIKKLHPKWLAEFDTFFAESTNMHCYNMFVCSKPVLADYCSWLFPILERLERKVKITEYPYQARVIGFMSERLFNFYVRKQKLRVVELPVQYFES